jgi:hypothetical protein
MKRKILILSVLLVPIIALFTFASSSVSVQSWGVAQRHNAGNIVIYRGEAYLATREVSAGDAPSQNSGVWRRITHYSNPGRFRYDSAYVAGDVVRHNNEVFVARQWVNNTAPNRNDLSGAWIFVNNHAPISGPIAKLPPHPGEAGKATILGIDSDGDGVRDDIQIAVTRLIPDDPQRRAAAMFSYKMHQEFLSAFLKDTTQTFEQLRPHFVGIQAGNRYWVRNKVYDFISDAQDNALLYNTRERFEIQQKINRLANAQIIRSFSSQPIDIQEKYNKMFQEVYEREKERQK